MQRFDAAKKPSKGPRNCTRVPRSGSGPKPGARVGARQRSEPPERPATPASQEPPRRVDRKPIQRGAEDPVYCQDPGPSLYARFPNPIPKPNRGASRCCEENLRPKPPNEVFFESKHRNRPRPDLGGRYPALGAPLRFLRTDKRGVIQVEGDPEGVIPSVAKGDRRTIRHPALVSRDSERFEGVPSTKKGLIPSYRSNSRRPWSRPGGLCGCRRELNLPPQKR